MIKEPSKGKFTVSYNHKPVEKYEYVTQPAHATRKYSIATGGANKKIPSPVVGIGSGGGFQGSLVVILLLMLMLLLLLLLLLMLLLLLLLLLLES